MERIPVETLKKIAAYVKSGGSAIAVGHLPTLTPEGKPLGDAGADTSEIILVPDEASLAQALHNAAKPDFQISATDDATVTHLGFIRRKLANADIYLVVNTSNQPIDTSATFATSHKFAAEWDGDTAAASAASATAQPIQLVAYGSRVFVFSDTPSAAKPAPTPEKQLADLSNDWKVNFTGLNKSVDEATPTDWTADPTTVHYSGEASTRATSRWPPRPPGRSSLRLTAAMRRQFPLARRTPTPSTIRRCRQPRWSPSTEDRRERCGIHPTGSTSPNCSSRA